MSTHLAFVLRSQRTVAGLSQNKLALAAGCDSAFVCRIEQGKPEHPSRAIVLGLADAMQLDVYEAARLLVAAGHWPFNNLSPEDTRLLLEIGEKLSERAAARQEASA